jgi:hypothetical protein
MLMGIPITTPTIPSVSKYLNGLVDTVENIEKSVLLAAHSYPKASATYPDAVQGDRIILLRFEHRKEVYE